MQILIDWWWRTIQIGVLYASLGFIWRDLAALMQATPATTDDPTIRSLTISDLDSMLM